MEKLQSVVEKQRGQIKKLEQSNIEFKSDNEEVSTLMNSSDSFINFVITKLRFFSIKMNVVIYINSTVHFPKKFVDSLLQKIRETV